MSIGGRRDPRTVEALYLGRRNRPDRTAMVWICLGSTHVPVLARYPDGSETFDLVGLLRDAPPSGPLSR